MPDVCLSFVLLFTIFIIVVTQKLVLQQSKNVTAKCTETLSPLPSIQFSWCIIIYFYSSSCIYLYYNNQSFIYTITYIIHPRGIECIEKKNMIFITFNSFIAPYLKSNSTLLNYLEERVCFKKCIHTQFKKRKMNIGVNKTSFYFFYLHCIMYKVMKALQERTSFREIQV